MKKTLTLVLALALLLTSYAWPTLAEDADYDFEIVCMKQGLDMSEGMATKPGAIAAEQRTGVKIFWNELEYAVAGEKINLMLNSNDLPDAFLVGGVSNAVNNHRDLIVPLDDYLTPENAPNLCAMFEKYPYIKEQLIKEDGHIYTLPNGLYTLKDNWSEGIQMINKTWLDRLDLEVPTTTDEYYAVLKAFKENDANGNGDPDDEFPLTFCEQNWAAHFVNLLGSFGYVESQQGLCNYMLADDNGQVYFTVDDDMFRAALEYFHMLASEGLLDVEGFTQSDQQFNAKINSDKVGTFFGWTPPEDGNEWVALVPMQNSDYPEIQPRSPGVMNKTCIGSAAMVITTACKDPAGLVNWYDAQNADIEIKYLWYYGQEGLLWTRDENNNVYVQWPETKEGFTRENMKYTYGNMSYAPVVILPEECEIIPSDAPYEARVRSEMVDAVCDYYFDVPVEFDNAPADDWAVKKKIVTDLEPYIDSFIADSVVNGLDDDKWAVHLETCKKYGSEEITEWFQKNQDQSW